MANFLQKLFTFTPTTPPSQLGDDYFYPISNGGINYNNNLYLLDYLEVPEVNAIINIKARAFANGKISVVSKATGKEVPNQESLVRALRSPNQYQSEKEFMMQTKIFQEVFGNEIIYFLTPVGFPNTVKGIYSLPFNRIKIDYPTAGTAYFKTTEILPKYSAQWNGQYIPLTQQEIIHINNTNPNQTETNYINGISQLQSLQSAIQNIRAAYEARNVIIANRGALGILSNDAGGDIGAALPLDSKQKEQLQKDFKKYGLAKNQWQVIITSLRLKWQQMSIDTEKLQLFEECKADTEKICDSFGVPFELLSNEKGVTFENKKQALKSLYQDTIIPEAQEWIGALNRRFETMDKSWELVIDYSHLPIFDENYADLKAKDDIWKGRYKDNLITKNEYYANVGLTPVVGGDIYAKQDTDVPLVTIIGVGGVQALQSVVADMNLTRDQKYNILISVFGVKPEQASTMV